MVKKSWNTSSFDKLAKVYRGGSPRPIQAYITDSPSGINWIKIGDVRPGDKYITTTAEKIIPEGVSRSRKVFTGDFILSNSMSFGRPYILKIDGCIHDGWLTIQDYQDSFDVDFLYYLLSSEEVMKQYIAMAAGSSVKNLNKEKVSSLIVTYPDKTEQIKIATALSDIDALVSDLEKLIEKKKNIRQGAMQELLTGKKRLPGFSGEWEQVELADLCYLITKQTGFDYSETIKPSLKTEEGLDTYPFIQNKDFQGFTVNYNTDFYVPHEIAKRFPRITLDEKCLLISISGRIGNVGVYPGKRTAFVGGAVGVAKFKDKDWIDWCMMFLCSKDGQEQIFLHEKVGAQHNLTVEDVRHLKILLPPKNEAASILQIIKDIDGEIEASQKKLSKYIAIKQGMMQKLLTGEIRLV